LLEDEADIEVLGEAGNAAECLRKVHELRPDIVVADAAAFDLPAHDVELRVRQESSGTKMVFLSAEDRASSWFFNARKANGGFAVRGTSAEELVRMVRNACGSAHLGASLARNLQHSMETSFPQERTLTGREQEVLKLLAEGKTVRAAAGILGLSLKTVDAHKFNLMRKLGIHNKAELVMWAIQKRIVKVPVNF
jgi:two-component system response regulator NreC